MESGDAVGGVVGDSGAREIKGCTPIPCPSFEEMTVEVTHTSEIDQLAWRAYRAYGEVTGGLNFMGKPMPKFDELPETIRHAWWAAVRQVIKDLS